MRTLYKRLELDHCPRRIISPRPLAPGEGRGWSDWRRRDCIGDTARMLGMSACMLIGHCSCWCPDIEQTSDYVFGVRTSPFAHATVSSPSLSVGPQGPHCRRSHHYHRGRLITRVEPECHGECSVHRPILVAVSPACRGRTRTKHHLSSARMRAGFDVIQDAQFTNVRRRALEPAGPRFELRCGTNVIFARASGSVLVPSAAAVVEVRAQKEV